MAVDPVAAVAPIVAVQLIIQPVIIGLFGFNLIVREVEPIDNAFVIHGAVRVCHFLRS